MSASRASSTRWVVVFNGARDAYQVPLALAEADRLETLVTDWYSPLDRAGFRELAKLAPPRVRAVLGRRFCPGLPSARVDSLLTEAARQWLRPGALAEVDARLGGRAGSLARRRGAGVLAYSFYAHAAFTAYRDGPMPRVLYQVQAHPEALRRLFAEEMDLAPDARDTSETELIVGSASRFAQLSEEAGLADLCLVPSRYVQTTMVENGVDPRRIRVVPYGVDSELFRPPDVPPGDDMFRVLFVGNLLHRKGLGYLLEAWKRLALPRAELLLVGRGPANAALLSRYAGCFRMETNVHSRERMRALYGSSHLCCVPSLSDSFGLVYLESLACGTPVIGTPNTGAADVVTEGEEGFTVPIRSVDALMDRLLWCYEHRTELLQMRTRARRRAEILSWAAFRREIVDAVRCVERLTFADSTGGTASATGLAGREGLHQFR